jgi:PDZ domain
MRTDGASLRRARAGPLGASTVLLTLLVLLSSARARPDSAALTGVRAEASGAAASNSAKPAEPQASPSPASKISPPSSVSSSSPAPVARSSPATAISPPATAASLVASPKAPGATASTSKPAKGPATDGRAATIPAKDSALNSKAAADSTTTPEGAVARPSGTEEIPRALPEAGASPGGLPAPSQGTTGDDVAGYENAQNPSFSVPRLGSLREFVAEGEETSSLGIRLRETQRKLENGKDANGLLVVSVVPGSPAAKAGLQPYRATVHDVLTGILGVAMVAAMVFPPAMPAILMAPAVGNSQVGESYDMIIAVDGWRVTNFFDFEERMRDVRPGELVYLSVVRNGKRVQITVAVPPAATSGSY